MVREPEGLPLAELRAAWRGVTPPPLADSLAECDAETRAVVGWMRTALGTLETPPVPVHAARRHARGRARPHLALPLAAAASALVAAGLWLWLHAGATPASTNRPAEVAGLHEAGSSPVAFPDEPVIAALEPDRIEMRSGPVRLVLLQPTPGR